MLILGFLVIPVLALLRVTRAAAGHRGVVLGAAAALGVVWVALRIVGAPAATSSATALAVDEVHSVRAGLQDRAVLARQLANDPFHDTPGNRLLTGLRGKDVLLVFVESYGQVAVQGPAFAPQVDARPRRGHAALHAAGFAARSAFLTSPTFGGLSWLAHSTHAVGLRVDSQRRYDQLVDSDRLTLTSRLRARRLAHGRACRPTPRAGRRAELLPLRQVLRPPQRRLPRPRFGYAPMPDQYTLRPSSAASSRPPTASRSWPRST